MMSDGEIKALGLIVGSAPSSFRGNSYDLRVHRLICNKGKEHSEFALKPRGIIHVLSQEEVTLPPDVAGIAMVKTGLSSLGVLALNIGIIDPGYHGRLSTVLLNFGNEEVRIEAGQIFLRLTFFKLPSVPLYSPPAPVDYQHYLSDLKLRARAFKPDFLGIDALVQLVAKQQVKKARNALLASAGLITVIFAVVGILVPVAINYSSFYMMKDVFKTPEVGVFASAKDIQELQRSVGELSAKLQESENRVKTLEQEQARRSNTRK